MKIAANVRPERPSFNYHFHFIMSSNLVLTESAATYVPTVKQGNRILNMYNI
jgi:hypothetical protein